jgi:hypothetical protein
MHSKTRSAWYRGRAGFALSLALIGVIVSSIVGGISFYIQKPASGGLSSNDIVTNTQVNFTCLLAYADEPFNINVNINLTDWMNRDEAIVVANTLFDNTLGRSGSTVHQLVSAEQIDRLGVWIVKLAWGYSTMDLGHWFMAEIDPFNRTIVYSHCK